MSCNPPPSFLVHADPSELKSIYNDLDHQWEYFFDVNTSGIIVSQNGRKQDIHWKEI